MRTLPALLISRLRFKSRLSSCQGECLPTATNRVHCSSRQRTTPLGAPNWQGLGSPFPAAAPIPYRLRVSTRPSLQNSAHSGRHGGSLPFSFGGRGRQAMHLPCKQAYVGALPIDSTSLRPLRCGGRKLPRRSSESGGGHYVPQSSGLRLGGPISTAGNSTNAQREAS